MIYSPDNSGQQHIPTSGTTDLRSRVVEILAGTVNGCLSELGYFPGMHQRMLELQQVNAKWQSENVNLFQDNQKLARSLREQNERSKVITGSDDQKIRAIEALEEKVRGLTEERANLVSKQNEVYHRLYSDYTKLSGLYGAAVNEIDQLRKHIQKITSNQQPLRTASRQSTNSYLQVGSVVQGGQYQQPNQSQHSQWPIQPFLPHQLIRSRTPSNGLPTANAVGEQTKTIKLLIFLPG